MLCSLLLINIRYKKENKVILDGLELFIFFFVLQVRVCFGQNPTNPLHISNHFQKKNSKRLLNFTKHTMTY